jgi:capsule biosynthesis phosphatase
MNDLLIESSVVRYASATPIPATINKLREARDKGWYITILTARHMRTSGNDVEHAFNKLSKITEDWLDRNDVPFDQLVFGKPYGVWYIDDKAMTLETFVDEFNP